jgi:hypothetical protein
LSAFEVEESLKRDGAKRYSTIRHPAAGGKEQTAYHKFQVSHVAERETTAVPWVMMSN